MHHEQLCEFVRDTPVGAVLELVESDNREEFYKLYLHDFVMGMHRCKHKRSDLTAMEIQVRESTLVDSNNTNTTCIDVLSACF